MLAALAITRMLHVKRTLVLCSLTLAMLMMAPYAATQTVDPYSDGWVSHVDGARLEICFDNAALPAVGQSVQLLRTRVEILNNKGVTRQTFTPDGEAQIVSTSQSPCVMATLLEGMARRSDHARAQDSSFPKPR